MDIEEVATIIAEETDLSLGVEIWLHNVPESPQEGIAVKLIRRLTDFGKVRVHRIGVFVLFRTWDTQKLRLSEIENIFDNLRGKTTASWSVSGEIIVNDYGLDDHLRYVSSVMFNIKGG
jgi:hypothetical protein